MKPLKHTNWSLPPIWVSPVANLAIIGGSLAFGGVIAIWCFAAGCAGPIQYPPVWLSGFTYRAPITINETGGYTLNDYQIKLEIQGQDKNKPNYMDFSRSGDYGYDISFTNKLNSVIGYWIQSWDNEAKTAVIWVKVPEILPYRKTIIYMYYGNPSLIPPISSYVEAVSFDVDFDNTMTKLKADDETRGLWHMDESGGVIKDSSRHNNHSKVNKTGRLGKDGGQFGDDFSENFTDGNALIFNGRDNYIQIPYKTSLDFNGINKISIEAWVYPVRKSEAISGTDDKSSSDKQQNLSNGVNPATFDDYTPVIYKPGSYALYIMADGKLCTYLYGPKPENYYSSSAGVIAAGKWSHIALTYDNEWLRFYINGKPDNKIALTGNLIPCLDRIHDVEYQKSDLYFGVDLMPPGPNYFSGAMDEIRILSRVLSDDEIKADYQRRQYCPAVPTIDVGQEETINSLKD